MLSQDVFFEGIARLKTNFEYFNDDNKKILDWYKECKDMSDVEYEERIALVVRTCKKVPLLADLLDENIGVKARAAANNAFEKKQGTYDWVYLWINGDKPMRCPRSMAIKAVDQCKNLGYKYFETERECMAYGASLPKVEVKKRDISGVIKGVIK